jgi:hypothetical protein
MKVWIRPRLKSNFTLNSKNTKHHIVSTKGSTYLTRSEFDILKHCNGNKSISTIVYCISLDYQGYANYDEIKSVLRSGYNNGWLE